MVGPALGMESGKRIISRHKVAAKAKKTETGALVKDARKDKLRRLQSSSQGLQAARLLRHEGMNVSAKRINAFKIAG